MMTKGAMAWWMAGGLAALALPVLPAAAGNDVDWANVEGARAVALRAMGLSASAAKASVERSDGDRRAKVIWWELYQRAKTEGTPDPKGRARSLIIEEEVSPDEMRTHTFAVFQDVDWKPIRKPFGKVREERIILLKPSMDPATSALILHVFEMDIKGEKLHSAQRFEIALLEPGARSKRTKLETNTLSVIHTFEECKLFWIRNAARAKPEHWDVEISAGALFEGAVVP